MLVSSVNRKEQPKQDKQNASYSASKLLLHGDVFMYGQYCYKLIVKLGYVFICRFHAISYPGAIFGSCHGEGKLGKQRLKGLRGVR